ncbi:MAG: hypothetical protein RIA62_08750 [Cyclobacteriaceae bacterium]
MSKKLLRVNFDQLDMCIKNQVWLSIILEDGSVYFVKPVKHIANILKVQNKMGRKMNVLLTQIDEIWADVKVS